MPLRPAAPGFPSVDSLPFGLVEEGQELVLQARKLKEWQSAREQEWQHCEGKYFSAVGEGRCSQTLGCHSYVHVTFLDMFVYVRPKNSKAHDRRSESTTDASNTAIKAEPEAARHWGDFSSNR